MQRPDKDFQNEVLERLRNLENDLAFIRGKIEGRGDKVSSYKDKLAIIIAIGALLVAVTRVFY